MAAIRPSGGGAADSVPSSDGSSSSSSSSSSLVAPSPSSPPPPSALSVSDPARDGVPDGNTGDAELDPERTRIDDGAIDDAIGESASDYGGWFTLGFSAWGGGVPHFVSTALLRRSIERFRFDRRKEATRLEDCIQALGSTGRAFLKELKLQAPLPEASCHCLALALTASPALIRLYFDRCTFPSLNALDVLADGLERSTSISTLSFTACQLRDEAFRILIPKLPLSVRTLDLEDNFCRSDGMAELSKLLLCDARALESVNLSIQHPGEYGGFLHLAPFGLALPANRTLKELDLSFNMFTTDDVRNLVAGLSKNSHIQNLNLMMNKLDDQSISCIGRILPGLTGLRCLNINANRFGDMGADSLLDGLKGNVSLTQLHMPLGFAASDEINYLVALNQGGRGLLQNGVSGPKVPLGLWPIVFKRIHDRPALMPASLKDSVVYFLLHGPAMFGRDAATQRERENVIPTHADKI